MFFSAKKALVVALSAVVLTGCAVTPEPIDKETRSTSAVSDGNLIYASQEPLEGGIDLSEAMARALKYNLDNRVKLMEEALSYQNFELVKMDMLPVLAASAGYIKRDNVNASTSVSIDSGRVSLEPSTSQDRERQVADLKLAWNVLDFGVSYVQAQQEADRALISENARRKVMLRMLQQTRGAFWRAVAMQQISADVDALLEQARTTADNLQKIRREQLRTPLTTLVDLRALMDIVKELEEMQQSVNAAKIELATLINVAPGTDIQLKYPESLADLPVSPVDVSGLELMALTNSMDYSTALYNARIDQLETRKAMLRLLPGIEFSYSGNYDSNSYLHNQGWGEAGIRVSWNIFRLFAHDDIKAQSEAREQLSNARRLAVQMGVVTQVHLAWQQYQNASNRYDRADEIRSIDQDIASLSRQAQSSQAINGFARIQNDARALRSQMGQLLAYADAQSAYGNLLFALNLDPVPDNYQQLSVSDVRQSLDTTYARWESGKIPYATVVERKKEKELKDTNG